MIATSGFLIALECTKFVFGRGSASDPAGGAYSAPPDPVECFKGPTSKRRGGRRGDMGRETKGTGGTSPLTQIPGSVLAPVFA